MLSCRLLPVLLLLLQLLPCWCEHYVPEVRGVAYAFVSADAQPHYDLARDGLGSFAAILISAVRCEQSNFVVG